MRTLAGRISARRKRCQLSGNNVTTSVGFLLLSPGIASTRAGPPRSAPPGIRGPRDAPPSPRLPQLKRRPSGSRLDLPRARPSPRPSPRLSIRPSPRPSPRPSARPRFVPSPRLDPPHRSVPRSAPRSVPRPAFRSVPRSAPRSRPASEPPGRAVLRRGSATGRPPTGPCPTPPLAPPRHLRPRRQACSAGRLLVGRGRRAGYCWNGRSQRAGR